MIAFTGISGLVLAVLAQSSTTWAQDYCSVSCRRGQHTMCLYPSSEPAYSCGDVRDNTVSYADQQEILDAHNELRRKVADGEYSQYGLPAARYIPALSWSRELAEVAQRWANQCTFGHDKCRNRLNGGYVGQNAGWSGGAAKDWRATIADSWFTSELAALSTSLNGLKYKSSGSAGHLTQVIWAATTEIGCGYVEADIPGADYVPEIFYVCNYGPGGNFVGENVYEPRY